MKAWQKDLARMAVAVVVLLVLQHVMIVVFTRHDIVSKLFAAGDHIPASYLLAGMCFVAVRITTGLFLPGVVLAYLGRAVMDAHAAKGERIELKKKEMEES